MQLTKVAEIRPPLGCSRARNAVRPMSVEVKKAEKSLLRVWVRGLVIDAQVRRDSVVHLRIRAQKEDCGLMGRIRQHLANALFRCADALHAGQDHHAVRVVEDVVGREAADDLLPDGRAPNVVQGWTLNGADRDTQHQAFLVYEGIEDKQLGTPAELVVMSGGKEGADDAHVASLNGVGSIQVGCPPAYQSTQPSIVDRLARGYFNRHPDRGLLVVVLLFGLAGAIAPAADLVIGGGL
ncbi:hypothetical protein ACI2S5_08385 [Ralstonia nicotianae]|uniref:hypothetical protein n=1 Tax=Ralstonia pseudosolanacearum TaxID=1310165 RepID=UPI0011600C8D|nr:hypothetical protein [Ralstonia pseudosolanacearum]QKL90610.1 hypothetical protein HI802_09100 [Ralstonia solanacearum]QKL95686.1 hypothetical protein HI801_09105 [Ralstonia solanacearum]UNJ31345.1 hypothetical protein MNY32_08695 [Ralstonia pseudosolanacearum]UZF18745.1 hypothetical protein LG939_11525 [Ralstonia solanacearum]